MEHREPLIPPLSLGLGALILSGAWLQPNHFRPWPSFHAEAWMAVVLLVAALVILIRSRGPIEWPGISLLVFAVSLVPAAHAFGGLVLTGGQGLLACAYLVGLGLAIVIGARWERHDPGAGADGLLLGIGLASIGSVGFQLYQWLHLEGLPFLSMGGTGPRPSANIGQANLLGTLLLWGVVAGAWGVWRGRVRPTVFFLYASFLLLGVAIADSRAAMLNAAILVAAAWGWRRTWPWRSAPLVATALLLLLMLFVAALPLFYEWMFPGELAAFRDAGTASVRLRAYAMLLDAVGQRPWIGYGWGQTVLAQLQVAAAHPSLGMIFGNAHNLIIDLMVWCGIPLALAIIGSLGAWGIAAIRRISDAGSLLVLMLLSILIVHAMLEYPFSYGFLLWPAGLFLGILNAKLGLWSTSWGRGAWLLLPALGLGVFTGLAVRDYAAAEENYLAWRFEVARVGSLPPAPPPPMLVLTQLDSVLWALRATTMTGTASAQEVGDFHKAFVIVPGIGPALYHAKALALAGKLDEAREWQLSIDHMMNEAIVKIIQAEWTRQSKIEPQMALVPWEVR